MIDFIVISESNAKITSFIISRVENRKRKSKNKKCFNCQRNLWKTDLCTLLNSDISVRARGLGGGSPHSFRKFKKTVYCNCYKILSSKNRCRKVTYSALAWTKIYWTDLSHIRPLFYTRTDPNGSVPKRAQIGFPFTGTGGSVPIWIRYPYWFRIAFQSVPFWIGSSWGPV